MCIDGPAVAPSLPSSSLLGLAIAGPLRRALVGQGTLNAPPPPGVNVHQALAYMTDGFPLPHTHPTTHTATHLPRRLAQQASMAPAATAIEMPVEATTTTMAPAANSAPAPKVELVPYSDLFYFADGLDWLCMFLGTVSACATGVAMPVFMLIFGTLLDEIGKGQGSFQDTINKLAMSMAALGAGAFVVSAFQVAFFAFASARQTERLRATLLRSILRQVRVYFE